MTKKTKIPQKKSAPKLASMFDIMASFRTAAARSIDPRKALLAQVAGTIAAGLVTSPSPSIASASGMATAAVDIAEEILKQVGIPSTGSSAETVPAVDLGAAS